MTAEQATGEPKDLRCGQTRVDEWFGYRSVGLELIRGAHDADERPDGIEDCGFDFGR